MDVGMHLEVFGGEGIRQQSVGQVRCWFDGENAESGRESWAYETKRVAYKEMGGEKDRLRDSGELSTGRSVDHSLFVWAGADSADAAILTQMCQWTSVGSFAVLVFVLA